MTLSTFIQQLINGFSLGSLYALIAIGYTMVYGIIRLINFAHGDVMMMSTYFAFFGYLIFRIPWYISFPIAMILTAVLGILIDRGAYKPVRNAPRISALITAIGVSFFLENFGIVVFGGRPKGFKIPKLFGAIFNVKGVTIPALSLWIPFFTAVFLILTFYIVYRTRKGMAMRAISRDMDTTRIMGVDVDGVISFTFALGSFLAAAGGIMWAMKYPQINPLMGIIPGLKAFVAAVFGGIGNVVGAAIGGILLGVIEIMFVAFFPQLAGYRDAVAFFLLIGVLIFKPTGIMGEVLPE